MSIPDYYFFKGGRVFERYNPPTSTTVDLLTIRSLFAYYPTNTWLYLMASVWSRIENEGHLMSRAGSVGDDLGSSIIASRVVRDLMSLCFLLERRYAPYPKWFGSAFNLLALSSITQTVETDLYPGIKEEVNRETVSLAEALQHVLHASSWREREWWLGVSYGIIATQHNTLNITPRHQLRTHLIPFHSRPFLVMSLGEISEAILGEISEPELRTLLTPKQRVLIGGIDHFCDNCNLIEDVHLRSSVLSLYQRG
jgi:hypothetical protein